MQCTRCGTRVRSARFCPNCGAPMRRGPGDVATGGGAHVRGNVQSRGHFVGRDMTTIHDSSGLHALTYATGAARVLLTIGLLLGFVGLGMFGYAFFDVWAQIMGPGSPDPPDWSMLQVWAPRGFGLAFVGSVMWGIGLLMNRRRH
jgi:hypothetical protein